MLLSLENELIIKIVWKSRKMNGNDRNSFYEFIAQVEFKFLSFLEFV